MIAHSRHLQPLEALSLGEEAEVWLARDRIGGQEMVCKRMRVESAGATDTLVERLRLARRLSRSGFLGFHDWTAESEGFAGFSTPVIRSKTLAQVAGEFGDGGLLSVLQQIAWAMEQLHRLDFVHCDLKPDNILIEIRDGAPVALISDLDWAVRRGTQRPLIFRGTHPYAAPEISEGRALHEATDVYAFGQILRLDLSPLVSGAELRGELEVMAGECAAASPDERIPSFAKIRDKLSMPSRLTSPLPSTPDLLPAVRDSGLRGRALALSRLLRRVEGTPARGVWVAAPPGVGKSRVMDEVCFQQQLAGGETLRVKGVQSLEDLHAALRGWRDVLRSLGSGVAPQRIRVFAESDPAADFRGQTWPGLDGVDLVFEDRSPESLPPEMALYRVPAWTLRETRAAIAHLHDHTPLANINSEALSISAGGIPWVAIRQIRAWYRGPANRRETESLNIDHLDKDVEEYWTRRFTKLEPGEQRLLERAAVFHQHFSADDIAPIGGKQSRMAGKLSGLVHDGWLTLEDVPGAGARHRFVCRSARNSVRCRIPVDLKRSWSGAVLISRGEHATPGSSVDPATWELLHLSGRSNGATVASVVIGLADAKLSAYARLKMYRKPGTSGDPGPAETALALSRLFERMGSTRRQKRWATRALHHMRDRSPGDALTIDAARLQCELFQLAIDPEKVGERIEELLTTDQPLPPAVRGYLLSELGGFNLWLTRHEKGSDLCHQAHHLLRQSAPDSIEYARNLNRLGLASSRTGHFDAARRYLEEAQRLATQHHYDSVGWRCLGNLGVVARDLGEPELAMDCSRRVIRYCRETGQTIHYLSALMNRSLYLVDLGHGYRARRAASLCVALAEALGDPVQLGHVTNNLGWVLAMQGEAGAAYKQLLESIRLRRLIGDDVSEAHAILNLAWLALMVRLPEEAEELASSVLDVWIRENHRHGFCEAQRIRAAAAMQTGDHQLAGEHLRRIPLQDPALPPRDRAETEMAIAELVFAEGNPTSCAALLPGLRGQNPVAAMNPLRLDYHRLEGLSYMYLGEHGRAFDILGVNAQACRVARRLDKLIETMGAQVELARRMGNLTVARRYLESAQGMIERMRRELPCRLTPSV
ncbi:MAG: tetratricopeptide repeat-containing protein kinase family protein [Candidatus Zixiibacteriota bacterium]